MILQSSVQPRYIRDSPLLIRVEDSTSDTISGRLESRLRPGLAALQMAFYWLEEMRFSICSISGFAMNDFQTKALR
jgi:hypothetical protein